MTEPMPSTSDPIARPVRALLELFEEALAEVSFPDVSADTLHVAVERVRERAGEVEAAKAALAGAEAALADEKAQLQQIAQRALRYARIYAEGRPELGSRLGSLAVGGAEPAAPKKRGRPRKQERASTDAPSPVLPFGEGDTFGGAAELM